MPRPQRCDQFDPSEVCVVHVVQRCVRRAYLAGVDRLKEIRERLSDLSWFMRALAEPIARMANKQDECTGRFWEGRFKAQRIVDEAGLLACSMYVDLNPVRAAIADSPDSSVHTSGYDRIQAEKGRMIDSAAFDLKPISTEEAGRRIRETSVEMLRAEKKQKRVNATGRKVRRDGWLAPLTLDSSKLSSDPLVHSDGLRCSDRGYLDISAKDYVRLLRWTARQTLDGASVKVPPSLAGTLKKLGIAAGMWRDLVWNWQKYFGRIAPFCHLPLLCAFTGKSLQGFAGFWGFNF